MNKKLKTADLFQIGIALLQNKEQIYSGLRYIDTKELEQGVLGINQEIFNDTLKFILKNKLGVEDFSVEFSGNAIRVTAEKFVKVMMLEKNITIKLKFFNIDLIFKEGQHFLTVDYRTDFEGIPPIIEKMPGGGAIKDMIISTAIQHKIKDAPWIDMKNEKIYIDFSRMEAFDKIQHTGIFGADVIKELTLEYIGTNNDELQFAYKTK
jgi:hypothetical protein